MDLIDVVFIMIYFLILLHHNGYVADRTIEKILDEIKPIYRMKTKPNLPAQRITRSGR